MQYRPVAARRKQDQGGFILLVVFLMAGAIALMLYSQLPRVAFESEREKEQLLIERGEQYVRAIQMYAADNNGQWPQTIDDLEKGRNKRYLRRRYVDPYTGKDEWRLIHTNGAQLTDSLVQAPPTQQGQGTSQTTSNTPQNQEEQVNSAVLARPSDLTLPGAQQFNILNPQVPGQPQIPGQPQVQGQLGQGQPGQGIAFGVPGAGLPAGVQLPGNVQTAAGPPGGFVPQFPGQQFAGQAPPPGVQVNQPNQNGVQPGGFVPQFPGQQFPGQLQNGQLNGQPPNGNITPPPGFQVGPNGVLIPATPGATLAGQPGAATPGAPQGTPNSAGVDAITRLLTTPRTQPTTAAAPANNAVGGGGLAGVASKHTGTSIKVYKERQKYQEWEFVYTRPQGAAGAIGGAGGPGGNGQQPGGTPGNGRGQGQGQGGGTNGTGFGTGTGLGQGTGFGQGGFGQQPNSGAGGRGGAAPAGTIGAPGTVLGRGGSR